MEACEEVADCGVAVWGDRALGSEETVTSEHLFV